MQASTSLIATVVDLFVLLALVHPLVWRLSSLWKKTQLLSGPPAAHSARHTATRPTGISTQAMPCMIVPARELGEVHRQCTSVEFVCDSPPLAIVDELQVAWGTSSGRLLGEVHSPGVLRL